MAGCEYGYISVVIFIVLVLTQPGDISADLDFSLIYLSLFNEDLGLGLQ